MHIAGVRFAVLGSGETCSGPARRMEREFVFQQLAMENVETLNAAFEGRVQAPQDRRDLPALLPARSAGSTRRSAASTRSSTTRNC